MVTTLASERVAGCNEMGSGGVIIYLPATLPTSLHVSAPMAAAGLHGYRMSSDIGSGLPGLVGMGFARHKSTGFLRAVRRGGAFHAFAAKVFFGRTLQLHTYVGGGLEPGPACI